MSEQWLNENLCSLGGDTVRIERGPQIVEMACNDANLDNEVTPGYYKVGARDAYGHIIMPERLGAGAVAAAKRDKFGYVSEGDTMAIVDRKGIHAPFLWKIYKLVDTDEPVYESPGVIKVDENGNEVMQQRFVKVEERLGKDEALEYARTLVGGA